MSDIANLALAALVSGILSYVFLLVRMAYHDREPAGFREHWQAEKRHLKRLAIIIVLSLLAVLILRLPWSGFGSSRSSGHESSEGACPGAPLAIPPEKTGGHTGRGP